VTTLEAVPLEEVLRDVLDGVKFENVPHLEDLTTDHMALVMLRVQQMRRAKIKAIEKLSEQVAEAVKKATKTRARAFLDTPGTQDYRTQASKFEAADDVFAAEVLKATLEAARESLKLLKDDWDTTRSINTNQRAVANATEGYGG
jgi:arginine deiminase